MGLVMCVCVCVCVCEGCVCVGGGGGRLALWSRQAVHGGDRMTDCMTCPVRFLLS